MVPATLAVCSLTNNPRVWGPFPEVPAKVPVLTLCGPERVTGPMPDAIPMTNGHVGVAYLHGQ